MEQDDLAIQWVHPVVEDSGEEESKEEESKEDESKEEEFLEEEFVEDEIVLKPLKPVTEVEQWAAQRTNKPQKRPRREVCGPAWIKLPTKLNRAQAEDRYFVCSLYFFLACANLCILCSCANLFLDFIL